MAERILALGCKRENTLDILTHYVNLLYPSLVADSKYGQFNRKTQISCRILVHSPYIDQHFKENESFSPFSPYGIAESSSKTINILNKVIATWQSPCSSYYHTSVLASFIWFIWTARSVEKDDSILLSYIQVKAGSLLRNTFWRGFF